jgi:small subunit ribosomal protein S3
MKEREFVDEGVKKLIVEDYFKREFPEALISRVDLVRTVTEYRIFVWCRRPRVIANKDTIRKVIEDLKNMLKDEVRVFVKLVENELLDAQIQAARIARALERGERERAVVRRIINRVLNAGAKGIEVVISGKLGKKGARSITRRFTAGYMIKTGGYAKLVSRGFDTALTKSGIIGVKVYIVPPDLNTVDTIDLGGVIDEAKRLQAGEVEGNEDRRTEGDSESSIQ